MALFTYIAFNKKGKEEKGIIDAPNIQSARTKLKSKGLYVRQISEDAERKDRELFPFLAKLLYRVPRKVIGMFCRQLGTLLGAGIPLDKSLSNIVEQTDHEVFRKVVVAMQADITEGISLSDAMRKHPDVFPNQYPSLVSVGERTGDYETALIRLSEMEDKNIELRSKVTTALVYPSIIFILLQLVIIFLLTTVVPQIEHLFVEFNATLPLITRIVIGSSKLITGYWFLLFPAIFAVVIGFFFYKGTPEGKEKWERFVLKIPIVRTLAKKVLISNFARNLGILLTNRVPLIVSLQIVEQIVDHSVFGEEIRNAAGRIREGEKLSSSFLSSEILPQMVLGMMSAGEASDRVPEMMNKLAEIYDSEVDTSLKAATQAIEPLMLVFMGFAIGIIMAAIIVPMFSLTQNLQGI
ncbi:type II secretion system F family protein [Leptospira wolffii]|uniref:Type II secretion system F family protein n=1 Tax=Leptospira wolffii TaxID=409998 RepID=A0A2M9Z9R9_9LEPT|nr:type II secretion system F family protein [Leptospira wolffii]EPG67260.1 type II secretion system protein F [Leptospira wolffii serovar Khorat str. Khorat-H2]PJZ65181.1 type II secretion system protein F [Leptospira wolffii]TGK56694.1 type II secretion system F family protein [Leptospira wolffii]TGK71724.1 type II secretion system F family protein [Leptospira wolffii]TGK75419.1 type II secretion system F family protein [Leptospira wolffii]